VLENYRVRLRFSDGTEGDADFSKHAGKGVFAPWADYSFFRQATLGEQGRTLTWPGDLDFCADALWLQITGKTPEGSPTGSCRETRIWQGVVSPPAGGCKGEVISDFPRRRETAATGAGSFA
jgi:hypothetical protein